MHLHILGICGTFMAGVAAIARELGHRVTGSDANAWPPMSEQLAAQGVAVSTGYLPEHLDPAPDCVVIGNALSRGNSAVEHVLERGLPYRSGPAWLAENVLGSRWVLAVAGTHGKTTTTSMLAWILERAGLAPGFLIGGVDQNFGLSARMGREPFFVIEADEYDTAFFDKRSKFLHYSPRTLLINNIEHDHADIFPDLEAIQTQFHHVVRIVPSTGCIVHPAGDPAVEAVLARGCWSRREPFGASSEWYVSADCVDASAFRVCHRGATVANVQWGLIGEHNMMNALAALLCARHAGVPIATGCAALGSFRNAKRRLELIGEGSGVSLYDDFAHHPSAIGATIAALRSRVGGARILAILELRSNSMRLGLHRETLAASLTGADGVWMLAPPGLTWDLEAATRELPRCHRLERVEDIVRAVSRETRPGDHVLIMSNGGFEGIHARLLQAVRERPDA